MTAPSAEVGGTTLHAGTASGLVLKLDNPLSFWGGVDESGTIVDRHHPQCGVSLRDRVLAMSSGRGSSSSTSVLAELFRTGCGPAAIVMTEPDAIVTLGAIVAGELYGSATPVMVLATDDFDGLADGAEVTVSSDGVHATVVSYGPMYEE